MIDLWKSQISSLSDLQLYNLSKDVEARIGSHVAGCNPIDEYVQKQQALLELIQDELLRR